MEVGLAAEEEEEEDSDYLDACVLYLDDRKLADERSKGSPGSVWFWRDSLSVERSTRASGHLRRLHLVDRADWLMSFRTCSGAGR